MQIAIDCAGFLPAKADKLRRAMATFRRSGTIHKLKDDFINGMLGNKYEREFAERCFRQIEGFGEYGFPESHAASFAILVYVSSWVKWYHPEVFAAALLNSQPMGFYAPAQLVRDAREHGVEVRPPDVNASDWDCTLEKTERVPLRPAPRLPPGHRPAGSRPEAHGRAAHHALSRSGRPVAARRAQQAPDPGAGARRRLRLAGPDAARRAVGGARLLRSVAAAVRRAAAGAGPRADGEPAQAHAGRAGGRRLLDHLDVAARPSAAAAAADAVGAAHGAFRRSCARPATATASPWPGSCWCASGRAPPRAWCSSPWRTSSASPISSSGPRCSRPIAGSSWARA